MAESQLKTQLDLKFRINIELTMKEAQALNEMVKYGSKAFLEGYYKQLGKSYLQPYEFGVVSLFETIKNNLPQKIRDVEDILKAINKIETLASGSVILK